MRKQVLAVTIGVLLVLSVFSVLQLWQIKPVQAVHVFSDGFDDGTTDAWDVHTNVAIVTSPVYSGTYAAHRTVDYDTCKLQKGLSVSVQDNFRWYVNLSAVSATYNVLGLVEDNNGDPVWYLYLNSTRLKLHRYFPAEADLFATVTFSSNVWYCLEVQCIDNAVTGEYRVFVDDSEEITETGLDTSGIGTYFVQHQMRFGAETTTDMTWDSAVVDNAYIGPEALTEGDGEATDWTYRISQNSTSCYLINDTGVIWDHGTPDKMFYYAIENCTSGGSIYVYPATYNFTNTLGSIAEEWTDLYLCLGSGTIINRTSSSGWPYILSIKSTGSGMHNVTVTSNGTAYFEGNNLVDGCLIDGNFNCTYQNLAFEHLYSQGIYMRRSRYCAIENISVYSYDESVGGQSAFAANDVQYSTFKNITLDGNYNAVTRIGFYMSDWEDNVDWNGSYFNTVEKLWIKNNKGDGIYLNSGAAGYHVYNNTFTNCTIENIWRTDQDAIKLRPAQNCTFTDVIIRNCTNAISTGSSIPPDEVLGNVTGNWIQAATYGSTVASLILTTDGPNQEVSGNFFNLTVDGGIGQTYFYNDQNTPIKSNTIYVNFSNCHGAINLENGNISSNTFYLNFSAVTGHPDICHESTWTNITSNTFNVYTTSGNPNGLYDFVNGTQGNIVVYPYSYSGPPPVLVTIDIISPTNTTYSSSTITVELSAECSGSTLDKIWWNPQNGTTWIYASNNTYTVTTQMTGIANGIQYTFHAYANATDGTTDHKTVMFSVSISAEGIVSIYVNTWWGNFW